MALVTLLAFVPGLILSPLAGLLADRYDRRLLMIIGDSLSAVGLVYRNNIQKQADWYKLPDQPNT